MRERTNLSKEQVSVKSQKSGKVSMALPRSDDGKVHAASGERSNTSAAHYADAMSKVIGDSAGKGRSVASGN